MHGKTRITYWAVSTLINDYYLFHHEVASRRIYASAFYSYLVYYGYSRTRHFTFISRHTPRLCKTAVLNAFSRQSSGSLLARQAMFQKLNARGADARCAYAFPACVRPTSRQLGRWWGKHLRWLTLRSIYRVLRAAPHERFCSRRKIDTPHADSAEKFITLHSHKMRAWIYFMMDIADILVVFRHTFI